MKKYLLGAAAALSTVAFAPAANAVVVGVAGQAALPFATLSSAGLNGGTLATLSGGAVLTSDQPFADIPEGVFGGTFLAAGPTFSQPAVLTFNQAVNVLGFLIGSPDFYNQLTVTSTMGSFNFTPLTLGLRGDGDQNVSQYVNFRTTAADERILSVSFNNNPAINAFEAANFSAGAVPEPAAWAMMIAGFGLIGGALRRQKKLTTSISFA